jgi:hypothetical protein
MRALLVLPERPDDSWLDGAGAGAGAALEVALDWLPAVPEAVLDAESWPDVAHPPITSAAASAAKRGVRFMVYLPLWKRLTTAQSSARVR